MIHCRTVVENPRRIFRRAIAALLLTATVAGGAAMAQDRLPGARDPVDQPFADNSIWNTPIGRGAQYQAADAAESRMLHTDDAGGHSGSYPWIGADAIGLYHARANDMVMRWLYNARSGSVPWPDGPPVTNGSVDLPTPAGVQFLGGSDGHAILIDPPGRYAYEVWQGAQAGQRAYRAVYLVRTDLRGSGIASGEGLSEGIRAFGGSLAGGIVRCSELAKGEIPHAVALLLSTTQLRKGATMADQKVWPATHSDGGGKNNYQGLVPMGALLALPPSVNVEALPLTREGRILARAYQRFGGYVVDATDKTMTLAVLPQGCDKQMISNLFADRRTIRDHLVRVLNNSPEHPGGPGERIAAAPATLKPVN
ncbi:hypothetical protein SPKIRA_35720 [Sphingomonas paucimobilis]|uniref:Uncharacterized protein n=3 Tax=Sphingomonas paucimobilis TaxID=13689 RepID=A0A411LN05_SPHPI|nr:MULTISPECIES: hypothetical protein [Sphingomonas]MBQ1478549.1 hypothetical protein [Sphingomonas sp.]MCM3679604.1 hypothetical protein [Sphingomonas paucimobilis]MDG5971002.1 hypothetical protein [Sphingomonas paucimobilis]NNG58489.1 hypothetical protein [Sphingomonas paucimobilis]QBE93712.1 hypothetical protein DRN02_018230 [Sphingomonas paucimobilis]